MTDASTAVVTTKRQARSRVSNGSALLDGIDGRSGPARRYRDVYGQLVSDLGGNISEAQGIICRRAATLAAWCETIEAEMLSGGEVSIGEFTTAVNSLRRLLSDLGLEGRLKDVSPTLSNYIEAKASKETA